MPGRWWRAIARDFLAGLALEVALCLLIAYVFQTSPYDSWVVAGFILLAAVWAVQIAIWLKKLIVRLATYYLYGKKAWVDEIETALHRYDFPIHYDMWPDAVSYLSRVLEDENATRDQIIYSAATLGQIELMKRMTPIGSMQMLAVFDKAFDRYQLHARRRVGRRT